VSLRTSELLDIELRETVVAVKTQGQIIEFDASQHIALQHLMTVESCRVRALPALDSDQQIALCRALIKENLLDLS